jgi:succinyl-CoA synthetase beta subunit
MAGIVAAYWVSRKHRVGPDGNCLTRSWGYLTIAALLKDESKAAATGVDSKMKIHEYQARQILRDAGIPVSDWRVARTGREAAEAYDALVAPVAVVKAQVHAGGRGKAGGVKLVRSREEAARVAEEMLSRPLVTPQTGPEGVPVRKVVVASAVEIQRELYVGMVVDRRRGLPVAMVSPEGGVDIEEVAARSPQKVHTEAFDPDRGLMPFQARKLAYRLDLPVPLVSPAADCLRRLSRVFVEHDCGLVEINPFALTPTGELLALDAKINFDDNAAFRHPAWKELRDPEQEDPSEREAAEAGISYVRLQGNIGCLVNGAGLAMTTMDIIKLYGGEPANFLDVGGGATQEQVTQGFRIILADPRVKAVLVNIFGGIMRCDVIAGAILEAFKKVGFRVPLVVRLEGTNVDLARQMLSESGLPIITAIDMADAAQKVVQAAQSR